MNGWYWDLVFHPSGNIMIFQDPVDEEDVYKYDFYNPWTGNLVASIPNIAWVQFADDGYMFINDDKLQLGLYRISDVLSTNPDDGFSGKLLTQFGRIKQTELYQNYPNPFNPETWIPYALADNAQVFIQIYSVSGQLIKTLDLGFKSSGRIFQRIGRPNGMDVTMPASL